MENNKLLLDIKELLRNLNEISDLDAKISTINEIKIMLSEYSVFKSEPVDCVLWVSGDEVSANDYNPNSVAPPEMVLLELSIKEDGYTQPIVTWKNGQTFEVVDGFHRNRVGKESEEVRAKLNGYLPVVIINDEKTGRDNRMASTIRHNRARGKHKVDSMSDMVIELKKRNRSNEWIAKNLGMDPDEVLRLCQISGLQELFSDQEFSKSWDIEDVINDEQEILDESDVDFEKKDDGRILHTWDKWECFKAGFYENKKDGMSKEQCEETYRDFLSDIPRFKLALNRVITEWKNSCEHYLTNEKMNRIAWLGQASLCIETGIPSCFRGGFTLLTDAQQKQANIAALEYLNKWLTSNGRKELTMEEAQSKTEADIY